MQIYNPLQLREAFHIEFLRWLGRAIKARDYAVKGGVNLRLFFKSFRYSEDMDLDARGISVNCLKDTVMKILVNGAFCDNLKPFGIEKIITPNISRAKQTAATQRFKIHLMISSGEDLFTKIEFSRRGFSGNVAIEAIDETILRAYKAAPLLAPHYDGHSAIAQKLRALASRAAIQARDIFDLYILSSQYDAGDKHLNEVNDAVLDKASDRLFEIGFDQFKDTVAAYLSPEDQAVYSSSASWEEVQLKVSQFIEEARKFYA